MTSSCKACGAEVLWAVTENGKPIPLDPAPDPDGNVELRDTFAVVHGNATDRALFAPGDDGTRYMPHFATCPNWT